MPARGSLLFYEGFDLANGSAPPTPQWATSTVGTTIVTNAGGCRIALNGAAGGYAEGGTFYRVYQRAIPNFELTFDIAFSSVTAESYAFISVGDSVFTSGMANNGHLFQAAPNISFYSFERTDASVRTSLSNGGFTFTAATFVRVRWRRLASWNGVKLWTVGDVEPADWARTPIDYNYLGAANSVFMFGMLGGSAATTTTLTYDNITVTELAPGRRRQVLGR